MSSKPDRSLLASLKGVDSFHDLLELDQVVKLEVSDPSIVTDATQIIEVANRWIVLDHLQSAVFQFALDGTYLGRIGRKGQGPGEYGKTAHVMPWKEGLAIVDSDRGNLLTYDSDGNHRRTYNANAKGYFLTDQCQEIDDRLYLSYFQTVDSHTPLHLVMDLDQMEPLLGFGERIPHTQPIEHKSFHALLRKVKNTLWSGRPFLLSTINIYDLEGRLLRTVPSGMPTFSLGDFADLDDEVASLKASEHPRLMSIFPQGELVIVTYGFFKSGAIVKHYTNVYDTSGNLLKQIEPTTNPMVSYARGFTDTHIVVGIDIGYVSFSSLQKWLLPHEMDRLIEGGFDPENRDSDNPWLLLYKVKPQMTHGQ